MISQNIQNFLKTHHLDVNNLELIKEAFYHPSYVHEQHKRSKLSNNQRLEYLGDSVLNLIINDYLYHNFLNYSEGKLAQLRSVLVSGSTLVKIAQDLNLGELLYLGKGEKKNQGSKRASNLSDCLEALIGVLYLDLGWKEIQKKVLVWFSKELKKVQNPETSKSFKSQLQELTQKKWKEVPIYEEVKQSGPAHDRMYTIRILSQGLEYAQATASTRKNAEQEAAKLALKKLRKE